MNRRLRQSLPLLLVAAVAAPALAAPPAGAAPAKGRCDRLKGKDLYPKNPQVKLVARSRVYVNDVGYRGDRTTYRACTGRHGKVRVVDYAGDNGYSTSGLTPGVSAGRYFLMGRREDGVDREYYSLRVYDAKTGRSRSLYAQTDADDSQFAPASTVLDASGAAAIIFADQFAEEGDPPDPDPGPGLPAGTTTYVAAFDRTGRRTVLDTGGSEIGRTSLALKSGLLSWSHGAETRTYGLRAKR
jgi:hypothetical protein